MTLEEAAALDAADPLAFARERFGLPDGIIYLDGNSLGALPKATAARIDETGQQAMGQRPHRQLEQARLDRRAERIAAKLAPIVRRQGGRAADRRFDSASACSSCSPPLSAPGRRGSTILTEAGNFPTDLYVAQGLAKLLAATEAESAVDADEIVAAIDGDTAVVTLTHVDYRSGRAARHGGDQRTRRAPPARSPCGTCRTAPARSRSTSTSRGCDLAVGCGYKYLNGGPGAPAFLFVAEHLQGELASPLPGWMGHAEPFAFDDDYRPAAGIRRFLTGTPSILALAALDAGLDTFDGVDDGQI